MNKENVYIFDGLSKEEISYFILMSETQFFKKGDAIIKEGEVSNNKAYIIEKGSVEVSKEGERIAQLEAGDIFGEIALIMNEPRTATVKALEDLEVLTLLKDDFIMLYQKSGQYQEIKDKILERIKNNFYGIKE
ncbi:MAG: cyclic nucleotide-binding domain-containing protein [Candidatus Gracilibacteria bacterium]|nr:cyclic nucleotide-binding domain-containing protein [Candidatus Gracilibacteria bacterium]MDD2909240.1 cyclic nucleotide-binding domain-containing protein [Candidatus Gracilibacteria bacterium]